MDCMIPFHVLFLITFSGVQVTFGLETFSEENDKIYVRRELDKMTQELLVDKDPFYHSYVFNSGVGNREKLSVEWMRQESWFSAEEAVVSWQAVRNIGQIHLLGRKLSAVTLVTAAAQLSSDGSAQLHEHSISYEANVTSTSLFTRWKSATSKPEVVVVVAVDTSAADILFYRVVNGKLEQISQWSRYRKIGCLTTSNVNGKNQLIVIDKGSPTSVDVFDILFIPDSVKLDFRLVQSFAVPGDCSTATLCRVGRQHYLVLPLPSRLAVYRLISGHYQKHTDLPLPRVSQVVCFTVALQAYLAVNGESSHVLRLTEAGEFVSELMLSDVREWLVLPVSSYRSDVLLLSKTANLIKTYVWAGANRGFDEVTIPNCDTCLEGDWSGAVSVPFHHQNCLLIPRVQRSSSLVIVGTSLYSNNPLLDKLKATIENIKKYQDEWRQIQSRMTEVEETLRYVVKRDGPNNITGRWTIGRLEGPSLRMSYLVRPQNETSVLEERAEGKEGPLQLETLEATVESVMAQGREVIRAVEQREKEAWGLDGFRGKVTFNGKLIVDNLTITRFNNENMDQLLRNTFRKDKPEMIQQWVTAEALEAEDIVVNRINNFTSEELKFSDGPVVIKGNVTFERPLMVRGEVELEEGGRVNGVDLSEEMCPGVESCSVFPMVNLNEEEVRNGDLNNSIDKNPITNASDRFWSKTIAGRNLTVVKINGLDWKTLAENVVYKNTYQNIIGTVVVEGKVTTERAIWADSFQYQDNSQAPDTSRSSPILQAPHPGVSDGGKGQTLDDLLSASELIVSELEVTGTVSCSESEWGAEAADVVLSDTNPIVIEGTKTFYGAVNVTNNTEVEGTVGGVVVADLFTSDTDQLFYGPTTLHGNITVGDVTLTGLWNGKNLTDIMKDRSRKVTADSVNVLDTLNGVRVSDLVFTRDDDVTSVKTVNVDGLYVTEDIVVNGNVCGMNLDDFNERRLSLQKDQNISGKVSIKNAKVTTGLEVKKLNNAEISSFIEDFDDSKIKQTLHLLELHVDGDIATDEGVNGFNLSEVAANAVWLEANNEIEGPLIFKDETAFDILEGQEMCNDMLCVHWLNVSNVVYKNNNSVTFTGNKKFVNLLKISEDLALQEINSHKIEDILTKTTEQEIAGDLIINGDVRVVEDFTVLGLLNQRNITELGHRCSLSENTITCEGNAVFEDGVEMKHLNTTGKMNEVEFDTFLKTVVRTDEPQRIKGLKRFTGNTVEAESIEDVDDLNGESWDDFLSDSVSTDGHEHVDHPVTFFNTLTVGKLSVDYRMEADTINSVNVSRWKTDAIYINESHPLERGIRLERASSKGNLSVEFFGGLDLEHDVIRLHSPSSLPFLRAKSVTVLGDFEAPDKVNGKYLAQVEQNTLKTFGDQTMQSDLIVGDLVVDGNLDTRALLNERDLRDVVTLASDQTLHGKYDFECIEAQGNVDTSEFISGINLTSWAETGVMKDGRKQVISGEWRVQGPLDLKGPVAGRGKLGGVNLQQLTDNITRDVLDVYGEMKSNLSEACVEANAQLASARGQHCKLQYLDVTQTLLVSSGPSLVTHFKSNDEDFLAISEKSCTTTIYKWNRNTATFASHHREMFGFALKSFIILNHKQLTYVLTESSETLWDCEYSGKHLWIFMKDHFKHVSNVNFFAGDLYQGEGSSLYVVNSSGMFKYALHFDDAEGRAFFRSEQHNWNITTDVPKAWSSAAQHEWLSNVRNASNCSGEVVSLSVDPAGQFVAVVSTEAAQVPRHADYIKVYHRNGQLFDKLPAQRVNQLQWLSVPAQTWLVALQNHSTLNLYQLQGPLLGFQLQISAPAEATGVATVVLPMAVKVNLQPFIILQTPSAVKVVQAFVQGDPYLGVDLTCNFDKALNRVPRK